MGTLSVLFKGPTAVQRTHIQSVFSVLIQMRICSLFNSPCWHATRKHPVVTPSQSRSLHTAASWHIWNVSAWRTKADRGGAGRQATATVHSVPIPLHPMFYLQWQLWVVLKQLNCSALNPRLFSWRALDICSWRGVHWGVKDQGLKWIFKN